MKSHALTKAPSLHFHVAHQLKVYSLFLLIFWNNSGKFLSKIVC